MDMVARAASQERGDRNAPEPIVLGSPYQQQNSSGQQYNQYGYPDGNLQKERKYATRGFVAAMVRLASCFQPCLASAVYMLASFLRLMPQSLRLQPRDSTASGGNEVTINS